MIAEHLPALQVVVPLLARPQSLCVRRPALPGSSLRRRAGPRCHGGGHCHPRRRGRTISYWHRELGTALGYRISHRSAQRFPARTGFLDGRSGDAVCEGEPRRRDSAKSGSPGTTRCICLCLAGLLGMTVTRRCLQCFRISRNFVAVDLCADRTRARSARALFAAYQYLVVGRSAPRSTSSASAFSI